MKDVKMKYWIISLFIVNTCVAGELVTREMYCDETSTINKTLRDKYQEIPVLIGKTSDLAESIMTLWTNPVDNTWTIVSTKNDYSCIIGVGEKLTIIDYKRKKNI